MLNSLKIPWKCVVEIREKKTKTLDIGDRGIKYAGLIFKFNKSLRDLIDKSIHNDEYFPLMRRSVSIARVLQKRPNLGVLCIDAHSDVHTPKTTATD